MDTMQPGQIIVPHGPDEPKPSNDGAPESERPTEQPEQAPQTPDTDQHAAQVVGATVIAAESAPAPESGWQFNQDTESETYQPLRSSTDDLKWTASEFIAHEKSSSWYVVLVTCTIVGMTLIYLLTKDKISTAIVLIVAIAFAALAGRKPKTQHYELSLDGLHIGPKTYQFDDFKTFSVSDDGAITSIVLMPLKRFMPPLTVYVAPDVADSVITYLGDYLPFEQHKTDAIDSLLKKIRF